MKTTSRRARFAYDSDEVDATFVCTLDGAPLACGPEGVQLEDVPLGRHRFTVAAVDDGVTGIAAVHEWTAFALPEEEDRSAPQAPSAGAPPAVVGAPAAARPLPLPAAPAATGTAAAPKRQGAAGTRKSTAAQRTAAAKREAAAAKRRAAAKRKAAARRRAAAAQRRKAAARARRGNGGHR